MSHSVTRAGEAAGPDLRGGYLRVSLACLFIAALTAVAMFTDVVRPTTLFLSIAHVAYLFWAIHKYSFSRRYNLFHPIVYIMLLQVVPMSAVKGLYFSLGGEYSAHVVSKEFFVYIDYALIVSLMAFASLHLGFELRVGAALGRLGPVIRRHDDISVRNAAITLGVIVSFSATFALVLMGRFGSTLSEYTGSYMVSSALVPIAGLRNFVFVVIVCLVHRGGGAYLRFLLGVCMCALLFLAIISGGRSQLFGITMLYLAGYAFSKGSSLTPRQIAVFFIAAVLAVVIGVVVFTEYRNLRMVRYGREDVSLSEVIHLMEDASMSVSYNEADDLYSSTKRNIFVRLSELDMLAIIIERYDRMRDVEAYYGMDNNIIKDIVYGFIPRTLWPAKPVVTDFGLYFTWVYLHQGVRSWSAPTIPGDLYRNFGLLGIPVGMAIIGIYLRAIHEWLIRKNEGNAFAAGAFFSLITVVVYGGVYSSFITGALRQVFAFSVLWVLFSACRIIVLRKDRR